jgi:hypothetical protein
VHPVPRWDDAGCNVTSRTRRSRSSPSFIPACGRRSSCESELHGGRITRGWRRRRNPPLGRRGAERMNGRRNPAVQVTWTSLSGRGP